MNNLGILPVLKLIWISTVLGFLLLEKERNSGICLNYTDLLLNITTNDSIHITDTIHHSNISYDVTNPVMNTTADVTSEHVDAAKVNTSHGIHHSLHSSYSKTNHDNSTTRMKLAAILSECCNNNNTFYYNLILCGSAEVKCIANISVVNQNCSSNNLNIFLIRKYTACYNNSLEINRNSSLLKYHFYNCLNTSDYGCYLFTCNNSTSSIKCQNISSLCGKINIDDDNNYIVMFLLRENVTEISCRLYEENDSLDYNERQNNCFNIKCCDTCLENGESCKNVSMYLQDIGNQSCSSLDVVIRNLDDVCTCITGYDHNDNTCITCVNDTDCLNDKNKEPNGDTREPNKVGDICNITSDCNIPFTECINNSCVCRKEYKTVKSSCTTRVLGDPCTEDEDCIITNFSICNNTCSCELKYIPVQYIDGRTTCKSRDIGDICDSTDDCNMTIANSECLNGQCTCKTGHKHTNLNDSLCILRSLFDVCEIHSDCYEAVENSLCFNNTCHCTSGYVASGTGSCEKRRIAIHQCITDQECYDSVNTSYCHENLTCSCRQGYISLINGTVCRLMGLFDDCSSDEDCQVAIKNSLCLDNRCKCLSGYLGVYGNQACERRRIYDVCDNDTDCYDAVQNSICRNRSCHCNSGFLVSVDKYTCTKRIINDTCNSDKDCNSAVDNSICTNHICSCKTGYDVINNGTECVKRPTVIGEPCYFPSQCLHIDAKAVCNYTCICPQQHFVSENSQACIQYPRKLSDRCSSHSQCVSAVKNSHCSKDRTCQCVENHFSDNRETLCRKYPVKIEERCLTNAHCRNIANTICLRNACSCTYKFKPTVDRFTCLPRRRMSYPKPTNIWLGGLCNIKDETPCPQWNITNQICSREEGRVNTRCRCRSGFANIYNAGDCHEIQTYFIRLNITEELGCYKKEADKPRCYTFSTVKYIKQYSNNNTGIYRDMKLRIQILGLYKAFNTTELWSRIVASEVINMTAIPNGIQVNAVVHIDEDYYDVMNASVFSEVLIEYLNRNHGALGDSNLKVAQPYNKNIYTDDFDECLDWNSRISNCSPFSWCINTYGSYMCSCRYEYKDMSLDTLNRPGRICIPEVEKTRYSRECSDGKCETNWIWMGLSLSLLLFLLISFLVYEIFSKKNEIQKFHPTYIPVKKSASKTEEDKLISTSEEENLINKEIETFDSDIQEDPPLYTMEP